MNDSTGSAQSDSYFLSIIIPVYNAQNRIEQLLKDTVSFLEAEKLNAEIIVVDDNSADATWNILKTIHRQFATSVKGFRLAANAGQYAATVAGINQCTGDYILTMDDDFNPPPRQMRLLLAKKHDAGLIYGAINNSEALFLRKIATTIVHLFILIATGNRNLAKGSSFRLFNRTTWLQVQPRLHVAEKLDVLLIKAAKSGILFVDVGTGSNIHSHTEMQLLKSAMKLFGLWPAKNRAGGMQQSVTIGERLK